MTRRTYDDRKFKRPVPELTEQDRRDRAVLSAMMDYPLKPGQMLLLGPKSVAILSGQVEFNGSLPDKLILERSEWAVLTKAEWRDYDWSKSKYPEREQDYVSYQELVTPDGGVIARIEQFVDDCFYATTPIDRSGCLPSVDEARQWCETRTGNKA